jgi:hypothetical protein
MLKASTMLDLAPKTQRLIEARSAATGKTPDEVVAEALQATDAKAAPNAKFDAEGLEALLKRFDAMPVRDPRSADDVMREEYGD